MNGQGIGTDPTVGLLVYGGLTAFALYQLLLWFGARERRALHLAAAALFIALAHALSGELAAIALPPRLDAWRAELAIAMPLLAVGALMSFGRAYLDIARVEYDLSGAMHMAVLAALGAAATAPAWGGLRVAPWLASAIAAAGLGVLAVLARRLLRSIYRPPRYAWLMIAALSGLLLGLAVRPHRAWTAGPRLEHALELATVACLFALGFAVAARARRERRAGREADLRDYVEEAFAADTAERAERDVRLAFSRRVEELAVLAGAAPSARGEGVIDPDWDREVLFGEELQRLTARNAVLEREVRVRRDAAERMRTMAYQDPLTGLPNRALLADRFAVTVAQARRHGQQVAVLMLDLDDFKRVNDTLGHDAGDRLLAHAAAMIRRSVRESDTVARLGGDEFVLLLGELHHHSEAGMVAQKLVARLAEQVVLDGHIVEPGASVGISRWPEHGTELVELLRCADRALYAAKACGKGTYRYFGE
ncbi:MAG: GGDEF domain-containing protein [Burkholderiales bacterium]|nr:GGDEF domain-containing protein [Burkholderiales bacterium]